MPSTARTRSLTQELPYVFADGILCRLQIWSEEEWIALPDDRRPARSVHAPGLGWVGALPIGESDSLCADLPVPIGTPAGEDGSACDPTASGAGAWTAAASIARPS